MFTDSKTYMSFCSALVILGEIGDALPDVHAGSLDSLVELFGRSVVKLFSTIMLSMIYHCAVRSIFSFFLLDILSLFQVFDLWSSSVHRSNFCWSPSPPFLTRSNLCSGLLDPSEKCRMAALKAVGVTISHVDEQQIVIFDSIRMQILQVVDGLADSDHASEAMSVSTAHQLPIHHYHRRRGLYSLLAVMGAFLSSTSQYRHLLSHQQLTIDRILQFFLYPPVDIPHYRLFYIATSIRFLIWVWFRSVVGAGVDLHAPVVVLAAGARSRQRPSAEAHFAPRR